MSRCPAAQSTRRPARFPRALLTGVALGLGCPLLSGAPVGADSSAADASAATARGAPERGPARHRVVAGEGLWDLAARYQVDARAIADANPHRIHDDGRLRPGDALVIPGTRAGHPNPRAVARRIDGTAAALALNAPGVAARLYRARPKAAWIRAAGPASDWSGALAWPVEDGHWVRGYGSGPEHYHLAVDIAADRGRDVRAAAPGLVAYAGQRIDGYGKLVFIVHPGGPTTMYAHNSALRVRAGQRVAAGDVIASVGSSGLSRGPHVHFELLFEGENCDPRPLFRPGIRERPDGVFELPDTTALWPASGPARSSPIDCADRRHLSD